MRRQCHRCLCRSCLNTCHCQNCIGTVSDCEKYRGFRQLSIFDPPPKPQYQKAPRHSWEHYGITKDRYKQLTEYIQSGRYDDIASQAAQETNKDIAEYILMSVKKNLSYDELQKKWELREIERMACGRSDFYGWRRYAISIFDKEMKKIGK